jgi:ribosomal protein S27AE
MAASSDRRTSASAPLVTDPALNPNASAETILRTCPNCGRELAERKCKLYCPDPRCGYFLSCAEFY